MKKLPQMIRDKIIELYSKGLSQSEIKERLDVSQWTVSTTITKWVHSKCLDSDSEWRYCPYCGIKLS